jgi:hypothetical protein
MMSGLYGDREGHAELLTPCWTFRHYEWNADKTRVDKVRCGPQSHAPVPGIDLWVRSMEEAGSGYEVPVQHTNVGCLGTLSSSQVTPRFVNVRTDAADM